MTDFLVTINMQVFLLLVNEKIVRYKRTIRTK